MQYLTNSTHCTLAMKLLPLFLSVDQLQETVQILPAFHSSPESLLHGCLCQSPSLTLPVSLFPFLYLPLCAFSLLLDKINRSALKFSVLSVKMAKRLTKRRQNCRVLMKQRLSLLRLLLLAPPTDNEMSAANAATRPPTQPSGVGRGTGRGRLCVAQLQ